MTNYVLLFLEGGGEGRGVTLDFIPKFSYSGPSGRMV